MVIDYFIDSEFFFPCYLEFFIFRVMMFYCDLRFDINKSEVYI